MKKIVVASDSFKGSLTSMQVASAVEQGIRKVYPECEVIKLSVADGGEGTMDALRATLGGRWVNVKVDDPLGRRMNSAYVILNDGYRVEQELTDTLLAHCKNELPEYMLPEEIVYRNEFPRTSRGKIDYRALEREAQKKWRSNAYGKHHQ